MNNDNEIQRVEEERRAHVAVETRAPVKPRSSLLLEDRSIPKEVWDRRQKNERNKSKERRRFAEATFTGQLVSLPMEGNPIRVTTVIKRSKAAPSEYTHLL